MIQKQENDEKYRQINAVMDTLDNIFASYWFKKADSTALVYYDT